MGVRKTGHRAFTVYYAVGEEMLQRAWGRGIRGQGKEGKANHSAIRWRGKTSNNSGSSAFVTDGALLGIKPIGRDAEHVVALYADAVDDGTYDGASW